MLLAMSVPTQQYELKNAESLWAECGQSNHAQT